MSLENDDVDEQIIANIEMHDAISSGKSKENRLLNKEDDKESFKPIKRDVNIPEVITIRELANRMAEQSSNIIKHLLGMGVTVTINHTIDSDTAEYLVKEFGHNPIKEEKAEEIIEKIKEVKAEKIKDANDFTCEPVDIVEGNKIMPCDRDNNGINDIAFYDARGNGGFYDVYYDDNENRIFERMLRVVPLEDGTDFWLFFYDNSESGSWSRLGYDYDKNGKSDEWDAI